MQKNKRVALIYGGKGAEHSVSVSGKDYVSRLIAEAGYSVLPVYVEKSGAWTIAEGKERRITYPVRLGEESGFLDEEEIKNVLCAFPLLHGDYGEDGRVQGALDCAGIPYVGCGVCAGAVAFDKIYTKIIAESLGIPTVRWLCFSDCKATEAARKECESMLGYPMFIKPAQMGSSIGASPVLSAEDFDKAYGEAAKYGERILVEKMLSSPRELECAALITEDGEIYSRPGEICAKGFYSYEEKYARGSSASPRVNASLSPDVSEKIREYSRLLCRALRVRQLARIDFFLDGESLYLNEINTLPGFTESSLYPRLMESAGIAPSVLLRRLIEGACK